MKKIWPAIPIAILGALIAVSQLFAPKTADFRASVFTASQNTAVPAITNRPSQTKLWIPVIVYHHLGTPQPKMSSADKSMYIEPAWFEKHLKYLQDNGFTAIHFSDLIAYFELGAALPPRPVIINFDDGYKSVYESALPLLKKYKMTATTFVITNLVGKRAYLTWDQIKELSKEGIEIGSHTLWHPNLVQSKKAFEEISQSKKILEEKLGVLTSVFAYPYGIYNEKVKQMVIDAGYGAARSFTTGNGISKENFFEIPVVRIWANIELSRWNNQLFPGGKP